MLYKEEKKMSQCFLHNIARNDNKTCEATRVIADMAVRWGLNLDLYKDGAGYKFHYWMMNCTC